MSSDYGILGNVAVIDAVGKNGGHVAVALVHPGGISMHTILNCDPDGRTPFIPLGNPGSTIDSEVSNPVHATVPLGHIALSAPNDPESPFAPFDPDIVLGPHSSAV